VYAYVHVLHSLTDLQATSTTGVRVKIVSNSPRSCYCLVERSYSELLPAPFMSTQRRSRSHSITQTQAPSTPEAYRPKSTIARQPSVIRTPDRRSLATISTLNTPPPNATIISKLKQKGISTDPVPRKRNLTQVRFELQILLDGSDVLHRFLPPTCSILMRMNTLVLYLTRRSTYLG
jgi:hypothetical protein